MKCNSVLFNQQNIGKVRNLLRKKTVVLMSSLSLLPIVTAPLLKIDNQVNKTIELDALFKLSLDETIEGKPRFSEKEKFILNEYYKKSPQLVYQMIITKKEDGNYKYNGLDIDSRLYRSSDEKLNSFSKINPAIANEILSNNTIPEKYFVEILSLSSKHPEEYLKMQKSGLFELISTGKINANILEKISQNIYLSEDSLKSIQNIANKSGLIEILPNSSNILELENEIKDGQIYQIKEKLYMPYSDKKYCFELKISPDKFLDLFQESQDFGIKQGKIGNCWLLSALDGIMDSSSGRRFIYSMFEQDGEDILIKFPKSKQKIRFKNGELGNANSGLIASKGIKMLEQAYAIYLQNKEAKSSNEIVVQEIKDLEKMLLTIDGGHARAGIEELLGGDTSVITLKDIIKGIYNSIRFQFVNKKTKGEISRYIEKIKKYANDNSKIVCVNFYDNKNLSQKETLIMPEYDLYIKHAYCVKKYNKETGTVVLSNPHDTRYSIEIPLSIIEKYIINCEVSSV